MQADKQTKNEISNVLTEYAKSYAEKNMDNLLNIVSPNEDTTLIGTGKDEWVIGLSEIKKGFERDLNQSDSIDIQFGDIPVSVNGNMAWTATTMNMEASIDGDVLTLKGRASFILEKKGDKWLIVHLHYSLPNDEQKEGQSFPEVN